MPYWKYMTFKTGVNPSIRSSFNMECLTGTQKVMLASSRIFGDSIGGNMRNGNRPLRANLKGAKRLSIFDIPIWDEKEWFPQLNDLDAQTFRSEMLERRKLRILMRGVKIGKKKSGSAFTLMNIFEKKKEKTPESKEKPADKKSEEKKTEEAK